MHIHLLICARLKKGEPERIAAALQQKCGIEVSLDEGRYDYIGVEHALCRVRDLDIFPETVLQSADNGVLSKVASALSCAAPGRFPLIRVQDWSNRIGEVCIMVGDAAFRERERLASHEAHAAA